MLPACGFFLHFTPCVLLTQSYSCPKDPGMFMGLFWSAYARTHTPPPTKMPPPTITTTAHPLNQIRLSRDNWTLLKTIFQFINTSKASVVVLCIKTHFYLKEEGGGKSHFSMGEDFCGWQQSQQRVFDRPPKWTIFLRGSVSNSRMRKAGFSCCRGNQITNTGYRLGKRRDAETKIKGGREEENPLENFRAMNCFTTLSSNRTVPSAKFSSVVLVSTRYLPPTQFVILGDLCFSKQEEIFRDREEKKLNTHHTT